MSSIDEAQTLWSTASSLLDECRSAMAGAGEYWQEISARFDEPLYRENVPPEITAQFLVAQNMHLQIFQRATQNMEVLDTLLDEGKLINDAMNQARRVLAVAPQVVVKSLSLPREELHDLIEDIKKMPEDLNIISINASTTIMAVAAPWYFIRDAFAVYLNKPTLGKQALAVVLPLMKEGLVHLAAKCIPVIGAVVALAESIKKLEEKDYRDFLTFVDQSIAFLDLEKASQQALADLDVAQEAIGWYSESVQSVNHPFLARVGRVVAFVDSEPTA